MNRPRTYRAEIRYLRSLLRQEGRDPYREARPQETAVQRYHRKRMPRVNVGAIVAAAWASAVQAHLNQTDVLWEQRQMLKELKP